MASGKHQRQLKVYSGCAPRQEGGEGRRRQPFLAGVGSCSLNSTWKAVQWVAAIKELAGEWSKLEEIGTVGLSHWDSLLLRGLGDYFSCFVDISSIWGWLLPCWDTVTMLISFFFFAELPTLVKRMFRSFSTKEFGQSSDTTLVLHPYLFIWSSPCSHFHMYVSIKAISIPSLNESTYTC